MNIEIFKNSKYAGLIKLALNDFSIRDRNLMELDLNERTISGRLGFHLQHQFDKYEYDVDCEYNKDGNESKRIRSKDLENEWENLKTKLNKLKSNADDPNGITVYPDVIVHKRNDSKNYAVVEIKKTSNINKSNEDIDKEKLMFYKKKFGYEECYFIVFKTLGEVKSDGDLESIVAKFQIYGGEGKWIDLI